MLFFGLFQQFNFKWTNLQKKINQQVGSSLMVNYKIMHRSKIYKVLEQLYFFDLTKHNFISTWKHRITPRT